MAKTGQRLINQEIDERVVIRPNKQMKRVEEGVHAVMGFGENNDYPQLMEKLIDGSVTAKSSANVYAKFLAGDGFENEEINKIQIGTDSRGKKITIQSLLRQVTNSISRNQGAYIFCSITAEGVIKKSSLKPFKNCRYGSPDETNYSPMILVYDNWEKDKRKKSKKEPKVFNVFNLDDAALTSQINKAGGVKRFKGQIYSLFTDNRFFYPLSTFDSSYLDCDTEAQLALFRNRQVRNGFFKKTIIRIASGGTEKEQEELVASLRKSLGPDGDGLWVVEDEVDENGELSDKTGYAVDQLDDTINDEKFKDWPIDVSNNIRKDAKNIPKVLIDYESGKLGSGSGEVIVKATNYYNAITKDDRTEVSEAFEEIFTNFDNETLKNNTNWKIKPLNLIEQEKDGITNTSTTTSE
jgi:hypothetical protein